MQAHAYKDAQTQKDEIDKHWSQTQSALLIHPNA